MEPLRTNALPRVDIADFIKSDRGVRSYEDLQGDAVNVYEAINTASFLTIAGSPSLGSERTLTLASGLTGVDGGPNAPYTLGLSDTTVVPGSYGSITKIAGFTVDAKGRLMTATEYTLNSDNVTEGVAHLYYTDARARAALSGTGLVGYNSTTGVISLPTDTDGTLAANSDTKIATQKATKTYVDNAVIGLFDFKGSTDCSANPNYPAALKGDSYVVTVAGKIGGASGKAVDAGDLFLAIADNAGGTEAAVGTSWVVLEHNLAGALLAANNLSDLANTTTARNNLGATTVGAGLFTLTNPSAVTFPRFNADNSISALTVTQLTAALNAATTSLQGAMSAADKTKIDAITSGSYTPTLANISNVSGTPSATLCYYERNGNVVTVWGTVTVATTAATLTELSISLPITPAAITDAAQISGKANAANANQPGNIRGNGTGGGVAHLAYTALGTSAVQMWFDFRYRMA